LQVFSFIRPSLSRSNMEIPEKQGNNRRIVKDSLLGGKRPLITR
jgi:hypothetical protein